MLQMQRAARYACRLRSSNSRSAPWPSYTGRCLRPQNNRRGKADLLQMDVNLDTMYTCNRLNLDVGSGEKPINLAALAPIFQN